MQPGQTPPKPSQKDSVQPLVRKGRTQICTSQMKQCLRQTFCINTEFVLKANAVPGIKIQHLQTVIWD